MDTAKTIYKHYKFRIYPSKKQIGLFEQTLDLCRELYNAALQERRDAWRLNKVSVSFYGQSEQLPEIKKIRQDLAEVNASVLQNTLRRLNRTFDTFFSRIKKGEKAGFPRFKSAKRFNSFTYPQVNNSSVRLDDGKLNLPKIGKVKIKLSRLVQGKVKQCTIKREIDKWYVFFTVETLPEILQKTSKQVGIDVGIDNFIALSDGTIITNPRFQESAAKKLRVANRRVSRRKNGSRRQKKAVLQLAKIWRNVKNQRSDFQHKISTNLIKDFDLIAIEKLNIVGLSKGILSKQVCSVAWGEFFRLLRYKAENADKKLIEVNPNGTSQTCICGEQVEKNLKIRFHKCEKCGLSEQRDIVSAKVILQRALGQSVKAQT